MLSPHISHMGPCREQVKPAWIIAAETFSSDVSHLLASELKVAD